MCPQKHSRDFGGKTDFYSWTKKERKKLTLHPQTGLFIQNLLYNINNFIFNCTHWRISYFLIFILYNLTPSLNLHYWICNMFLFVSLNPKKKWNNWNGIVKEKAFVFKLITYFFYYSYILSLLKPKLSSPVAWEMVCRWETGSFPGN